jgi:hypothetical protein
MRTSYTAIAMASIAYQVHQIDEKITQYFDTFGSWAEVSIEVRDLRKRKLELELQFHALSKENDDG